MKRVTERRGPVLKELEPLLGRDSSPESFQVLAQQGTEKSLDCRKRSRAVVETGPDVDEPQSVHRDSVPSLQAIPIASAKDLRMGRPGKSSFVKSNCPWKRVKVAKVLPETLRQRTSPEEVTLSLDLAGTEVTPRALRRSVAKVAYSVTQGESVEQEFVVGLLLPRRVRPVMETLPNVLGWATEFRDAPGTPVQRAVNTLLTVKKPASQGGGKGKKQHTSHLDVCMQVTV